MALYLHTLLFILPSLAAASRIPAVIVFGDSTIDAGNHDYILTLVKADFPPYGRDFPGGRPTGRFCKALGLPPTVPTYLDPSYSIQDFATGVCFASAGTGLDAATSNVVSVIPLRQEVELFKEYQKKLTGYAGEAKARHIIGEAVYVVSVGTNDFIENYFSPLADQRREQFTVEEHVDFLVDLAANFVSEIYRLRARKVCFIGLTPFGCLPTNRATNLMERGECMEEYNEAARSFNRKLQAMVGRLHASLPGLRLVYNPVYDFLLRVIRNPESYGKFAGGVRGGLPLQQMESQHLRRRGQVPVMAARSFI
ncbi:GDSL esterase lipase [Musa troglodytarum]|uniref:GDSL esterase lipase n=1 Tax=Musa troglodytarum TaxID=320322 RepID=A0A9E7EHB7_9LILI|nr:GDSL esterase lipase [Musa troglodytarum]